MTYTATYSPDDDKVRLYASSRLDPEIYAKVKAAGFRRAPKQELFFAFWNPKAEDVALELAGEIDDEDKTLVERAEERADRFETYSENRQADADRAHKAVSAIADNIPLGQPILVGHHSEKHARRDAAKIQNGMQKAVSMWKQSTYWKDRAAAARHHAEYKEFPAVRARRIKTLEADLRQQIARYTPLVTKERPKPTYIMQQKWSEAYPAGEYLSSEEREAVPQKMHVWTGPLGRGGAWTAVEDLPAIKAASERYEEHLMHRLEYEHAMLGEQIGADTFSTRFDYAIGGKITVGREAAILTILKLNKKDGQVVSVSTNSTRWTRIVQLEDIKTYEPPAEGAAEQIKSATKLPPMCNYPGENFKHMTLAEWKSIYSDNRGSAIIPATETAAAHRVRKHYGCMRAQPHIYITDEKRKDPPPPEKTPAPAIPATEHNDVAILANLERQIAYNAKRAEEQQAAAPFEALQDALKAGIQVVTANQLFPTPPELARRMVELADVQPGQRVLEPSAGTGNIIAEIFRGLMGADCGHVTAIELNPRVAEILRADRNKRLYANDANYQIICEDFLEVAPEARGTFHCIVMNPPFENGADIKHIQHALTFLKPGGRLVAICANGPRQNDKLKPMADSWEELPAGTFPGTNVRAVLLTIDKAAIEDETLDEEPETVTPGFHIEAMGGILVSGKPALAQDDAENQRMTYAGRPLTAVREAKIFDHTRLETSPLFQSTVPKLF